MQPPLFWGLALQPNFGTLGHGNRQDQLVPLRMQAFHPTGPRVRAIHTSPLNGILVTDNRESWLVGRVEGERNLAPRRIPKFAYALCVPHAAVIPQPYLLGLDTPT